MNAPRWDLLLTHATLAPCGSDDAGDALVDAALACADGRIAWLGPMQALPPALAAQARRVEDLGGALVTPGLVDCHTHLVFAGHRAGEFDMRLHGASYESIARAGGGIAASVQAVRAASEDELLAQSLPRARALLRDGVTTLEIKSGYGLEPAGECRMLRVARRIGRELGITVRTSFLGLHALSPDYADRRGDYVAMVCDELLPALAGEGLVDAVDGFCEGIGFGLQDMRRLFERAKALGLPVKLHAGQLSELGGAALVAAYGGLSADHLEHLGEDGVAAMARAGTVAVLLPGAFYALRETKQPPVDALRAHGVPIAVATDCNPGTSPLLSLRLAANMACTLFRLTPQEALRGITANAARALGLDDRGTLAPGQHADLVVWNATRPAELCYWIGGELVRQVYVAGQLRRPG